MRRELHTTAYNLTSGSLTLDTFSNLQHLSLDLSSEGLCTQQSRIRLLFKSLPTKNSISHLCLSYVPRIGAPLLKTIASKLPKLRSLHLTSLDRLDYTCCWNCLNETASCARITPIPEVYATAENLAV
jgi:hypothetical protein